MENQTEIWRTVQDAPQYEISNKNGWKRVDRKIQPKGTINKGYRRVTIGDYKVQFYHILVAKTFPEICGEWFDGCEVHHINFNKLDNRPENLIVLTKTEHHKVHYESQPDTFRKSSPKRSKSISKALENKPRPDKWVPIKQLSKNGCLIKTWSNLSLIKKELGYSIGNICSCCKGKLKTAYGYKWSYAVNN